MAVGTGGGSRRMGGGRSSRRWAAVEAPWRSSQTGPLAFPRHADANTLHFPRRSDMAMVGLCA